MSKQKENKDASYRKCYDSIILELGAYEACLYHLIEGWIETDHMECFIGNDYIGYRLGISDKTAQRLVHTLEEAGYIKTELHPSKPNKARRHITLTDKRPTYVKFRKMEEIRIEKKEEQKQKRLMNSGLLIKS